MDLNITVVNTAFYPDRTNLLPASGLAITCNGSTIYNDNTVSFTVSSNTSVTLTITKSGFRTFTNTFTVYEIQTLDLLIYMEPEVTDSSDPDYQRCYPNFAVQYIPGTYNALIIDLTSNTGNYTYYVDKTSYSTERNFIVNFTCAGDHEIIQRITTYNNSTLGSPVWWDVLTWLDSETDTLLTQSYYETGVQVQPFPIDAYSEFLALLITECVPSNSISVTYDPVPCAGESDCTCIPLGTEITLTPQVVLNLNNQPYPLCTESTLEYKLYDFDGNLLDTTTYTIVNADPIDNSTLTYSFTPVAIGDYSVVVTLTNCSNSCVITEIIHNCNYIKITPTVCHSYTIYNCSTDINTLVTVRDIDDNILTGYESISLVAQGNITLNTPSDGCYIVTIMDDENNVLFIYPVIDICDLSACLQTRILGILCDCGCASDCTDYCKKRYDLEVITTLAFALFNKINALYTLNTYFTSLDDTTLADLVTQQQYIDKINTYCDSCGSGTLGVSKVLGSNSSNSGCGCS